MDQIELILTTLNDKSQPDIEKQKALTKLEDYQVDAERAIRNHQREVSFETKEYTVELTVSKYSEGLDDDTNELFVPDYQRDFVWDEKKKSRLIESILIGLPIPYIFIADTDSEDDDETYDTGGRTEIVDGSQRIRTLHAFVNGNLKLTSLELLTELNGFYYDTLPKSRQRRFLRSPIRIIELGSCTESTRRDLFERINTGSDILKDMEVRKGSTLGDTIVYKNLIVPCSENEDFKAVAPMTDAKVKRGERLEFTLRFFAYLERYKKFEHSVREFLNDFIKEEKGADNERIEALREDFCRTMKFAREHLSAGFAKTARAKSTPRVRFEALAVGIALALREDPNIEPQNIASWIFSNEFKELTTSDAANSKTRVIERIEYVKNKILDD